MSDIFENVVIKTRWRLDRILGKGAFGSVYAGLDLVTGAEIAVKVEHPSCKKQLLKLEINLLRKLQKENPYTAEFLACGKFIIHRADSQISVQDEPDQLAEKDMPRIYWYVVMSLLGESLSDYKKRFKDCKLDISEAARLGIDMIGGIEQVHNTGFLHRDIKPANFCMPRATSLKKPLSLIDFGLARRFCSNGVIREPRKRVGFRGTARYASVRAHEGKELGRVDDLWSLFYTLLELMRGQLPWKGKDRETIYEMKLQYKVLDLLAGLPYEMIVFHEYLNLLAFDKEPDYSFLSSLCSRMIDPSVLVSLPKEFPPKIIKCSGSGVRFQEIAMLLASSSSDRDQDTASNEDVLVSGAALPSSPGSIPLSEECSLNAAGLRCKPSLLKSRIPPGLAVFTRPNWQHQSASSKYDDTIANPCVTSETSGTQKSTQLSSLTLTSVSVVSNGGLQSPTGSIVFSPATSTAEYDNVRPFGPQMAPKSNSVRAMNVLQRKTQFPMRINTANMPRESFTRAHKVPNHILSPTCHTGTEQLNSPTLYSPISPSVAPESPAYAVRTTGCHQAPSLSFNSGPGYQPCAQQLSPTVSSSSLHTLYANSKSQYPSNEAIYANEQLTQHFYYPQPPTGAPPFQPSNHDALSNKRLINSRLRGLKPVNSIECTKQAIGGLPTPQNSLSNIS